MDTHSIRYCPGCMSAMREGSSCGSPACGWNEADEIETYDHLPRNYVLLDRYYIGRVLGQSSFGVTYLARDLKLDDLVAIKEFLPREQCMRLSDHVTVRSQDGEKAEHFQDGIHRFLDEAEALVRFSGHPNLLSVKDFNRANGTAYLVMEFLSGITLRQYLASHGGNIPYETAVDIMLHVMSALRKVHANGRLHRDVSPDNIMITRQGLIKLLGFDSTCDATKVPSRHLSVILKPGFCPEEQYRTRGVQGEWTDVYSVAATLYRCITGSTPPPAPDRLIQDVLVSPSTLCPGLPAGLEAALFKGLAVKAENRYQTIDEFQHDVRPALHTLLRWVAGLNKRREGRERGSSSGRGSF